MTCHNEIWIKLPLKYTEHRDKIGISLITTGNKNLRVGSFQDPKRLLFTK